MAQQPAGMNNSSGVILSIGFFGNSEAFEIVMPMVTDDGTLDATSLCQDAVLAFVALPLVDLRKIIATSVYVAFVSAQGMVNGVLPYRNVYASGTYPGTGAGAAAIPTNACALGAIYQDPEDATVDSKVLQARTFFSGISSASVVQNAIDGTLQTNILTFMSDLQSGYNTMAGSGAWYRCLKAPKPRAAGTPIQRLLLPDARGVIYTQKRRLVPRQ